GTEILFHIGLDTVNLDGKYFESFVREGQAVRLGELMIKFNLEEIQKAGFDSTTIIVITEPKNAVLTILGDKQVTKEEKIFTLEGIE
ncbi:PTS glucose transporter subunit IIA, partial [Enterococcus faecalis]